MTAPRPLVLALALAACGSPLPDRGAVTMPDAPLEAEAPTVVRWVAGTPTYVYGEGYVEQHRFAVSVDGPWHTAPVEAGEGMQLVAGALHRIRLRPRTDAAAPAGTVYEVVEVLESRPGGPPTAVWPGQSVAGISVQDVRERDGVRFGPFRFDDGEIVFRLSEVGAIRLGDRRLASDATLTDALGAFDGCLAAEDRPDVYVCDGARLSEAGGHVDVAITAGG